MISTDGSQMADGKSHSIGGIVEDGYVDTSVSCRILQELHIICSGFVQDSFIIILPLATQLVLDLKKSVSLKDSSLFQNNEFVPGTWQHYPHW